MPRAAIRTGEAFWIVGWGESGDVLVVVGAIAAAAGVWIAFASKPGAAAASVRMMPGVRF